MFRFKVVPEGGDAFEVESTTRDILKWEKTTKGTSASQLREPSLTALYKIAWLTAQRTGQYTGTLADFEATADIETIDEAEEPDPTQSAASSDTSSL